MQSRAARKRPPPPCCLPRRAGISPACPRSNLREHERDPGPHARGAPARSSMRSGWRALRPGPVVTSCPHSRASVSHHSTMARPAPRPLHGWPAFSKDRLATPHVSCEGSHRCSSLIAKLDKYGAAGPTAISTITFCRAFSQVSPACAGDVRPWNGEAIEARASLAV